MRHLQPHAALYAGTWFRSRLEATWAAFFDAYKMRWTYEQDAFEFADGTRYMPDFWLPESRAWFEVKGRMTEQDQKKIVMLEAAAGERGETVLLGGAPAGVTVGYVVTEKGLDMRAEMSRCRRCERWTFSLLVCRACGFSHDSGEGDRTTTGLLYGTFDSWLLPCRGECGAYGFVGNEIKKIRVNHEHARSGLDALTCCGLHPITWGIW